jgi:hypothetical protein
LLRFPTEVKFTSGSFDDLTRYEFASKSLGHYFCPVCGSGVLGRKLNGDKPASYAVNLRQVEGVDLKALTYQPYDGANI